MERGAAQGTSDSSLALSRRFKWLGLGLLLLYVLATARGGGEFWPFSKFGMFSRPRPWTRSLVVELSTPLPDQALVECWEKELPGPVFPLHRHQINQDDLSATLRSFNGPLTADQTAFLAQYFERVRHDHTLVLYSAGGRFRPDRSVRERFTPIAVIGPEGARSLTPPAADGGVPLDEAGASLQQDGGLR